MFDLFSCTWCWQKIAFCYFVFVILSVLCFHEIDTLLACLYIQVTFHYNLLNNQPARTLVRDIILYILCCVQRTEQGHGHILSPHLINEKRNQLVLCLVVFCFVVVESLSLSCGYCYCCCCCCCCFCRHCCCRCCCRCSHIEPMMKVIFEVFWFFQFFLHQILPRTFQHSKGLLLYVAKVIWPSFWERKRKKKFEKFCNMAPHHIMQPWFCYVVFEKIIFEKYSSKNKWNKNFEFFQFSLCDFGWKLTRRKLSNYKIWTKNNTETGFLPIFLKKKRFFFSEEFCIMVPQHIMLGWFYPNLKQKQNKTKFRIFPIFIVWFSMKVSTEKTFEL